VPQIFHHQINDTTQLAVWHITEPESFFASAAQGIRNISHPHKRLQHLCGRYLLQHLVPHFPLHQIVAEHNNKPFLPNHPYHFSISHCDDYVTALVSTTFRVGIDVETVSKKVAAIRHKFLSEIEERMLANETTEQTELQKLTIAWSAKEAMFKWLGESGVDFKEHLVLNTLKGNASNGQILATLNRSNVQYVTLQYNILDSVVLTWLAN
jgi:phosphopantetheinyl transferase